MEFPLQDVSEIQNALLEVRTMAASPSKLAAAEAKLVELIDSLSVLQLADSQLEIRETIQSVFLPKRKRRLLERLDQSLVGAGTAPRSKIEPTRPAADINDATDALGAFRSELRTELIDLADRHIFQWPYYENFASRLFDAQAPRALTSGATLSEVTAVMREEIAAHTKEVLQRTFVYSTNKQRLSEADALTRGSSSLAALANIAVSEYRRQLSRLRLAARAADLRGLCSSFISGVLIGGARAALGSTSGRDQLFASWKLWVQHIPLMTYTDLERFQTEVPANATHNELFRLGRPIASALDERVKTAEAGRVCVLRNSFYSSRFNRLDLTLVEPVQAAQKEIFFHCYLSEEGVDKSELESAVNRGMQLILAPVTDELARWLWKHELDLGHKVIDTAKHDAGDRLRFSLSLALASISTGKQDDVPITHNFARQFPLDKPEIGADFRVSRRSVRRLLEQHHSETGVRLWSSVRRSGKTTACVDLQVYQGPEIVITETCDVTGAANLKDSFYRAVSEALDTGQQLPSKFVYDAIQRSADYDVGNSKLVFVLDEYETLFKRLDSAAEESNSVRYKVVQPFLNQLVEFAQRHLVILLGLQPDAHFILMEQNQLSPYVRHDQFPLFEFKQNEPDCEFRELVKRVLTERMQCEDAFIGHLYSETGGHPVLTVNVLTSLCDWLIDTKRPLSRLRLTGSDFEEFASHHLTAQAIGLNAVYDIHRKFAQHGMSVQSRKKTPWLYAVLQVLRYIAAQPKGAMACSLADIDKLLSKLGLDQISGIQTLDLVRTGAMANFFTVNGERVRPRIKLYARLTASVAPTTRG